MRWLPFVSGLFLPEALPHLFDSFSLLEYSSCNTRSLPPGGNRVPVLSWEPGHSSILVPGKQLKMDFYLLNQFNEINLLTTPTLSMASVAAANETKYKVFGTLNYLFLSNP